ncbi:MAG: glucose-6-phosphate isomerase, partial [Cyclobacteriaceae bacterium]
MFPNHNPTETQAWVSLQQHYLEMQATTMRDLFEEDPSRFEKLHLTFSDILVDFSKNIITTDTLALLKRLAEETELPDAIQAMFNGEKINQTEARAVWHVALRNQTGRAMALDGQDVMPEVNRVLDQIRNFSDGLLSGAWK